MLLALLIFMLVNNSMPVTHLHIEASSYCNAHCPGCPRNAYGYPLEGFYNKTHLSPESMHRILAKFSEVRSILFCGNHGDPMMNPDIVELCEVNKQITIATNGGIGKLEDYESLANNKVNITFGIDGLEDTNHLYRQGVKWDNLMKRVSTFIKAGGKATWQFIRFKHNMDQVERAKSLSKQMGFENFFTMDVGRNNMPAIQPDKSISHWILPPNADAEPQDFDVDAYLEMRYNPVNLNQPKYDSPKLSCEHLDGSVYVNSDGELFPCCYHGFGHIDRPKVYLNDFDKLKSTWNTKNCNQVCAESCGAP